MRYVIAIDPDVDASGYACLYGDGLIDVCKLSFSGIVERLRMLRSEASVLRETVAPPIVVVEAGWLNRSNWHLPRSVSANKAAAMGVSVGRNQEVGMLITEMAEAMGFKVVMQKPLSLKSGAFHLWNGRDGKITAEEFKEVTGWNARTNQDMRDAGLLAWTYAGLPVKVKPKK